MSSIPASQLVAIQPGVLGSSGSPLSLNAVFLTEDTAPPIGSVLSFATVAEVATYFGPASDEAALASIYFGGFTGATVLPGALLVAQYAASAVAAYIRASALTLTLAQLQAMIPAVTTAAISGTTLTVSAVASGTVVDGMLLTGTGVTAGTTVVEQLTGAVGSIGTYRVSATQTAGSTTITGNYTMSLSVDGSVVDFVTLNLSAAASFSAAATAIGTALGLSGGQTCTFDSQFAAFVITSGTTGAASTVTIATGNAAALLGFNSTATLSQGSAAMTEAGIMNTVIATTMNWATFMTVFEPNTASKLRFADWVDAQNQRFLYVAWDTDTDALDVPNDTSFGPLVVAAAYTGVCPVYMDRDVAAFICAITGSINFTQQNGRVSYAYRAQSGIAATITNATDANNLIANGYNFYGSYATATATFTNLQPGSTPGVWKWLDSYVNQIAFNNALQLAGMNLMSNVTSLPYNAQGMQMIRDTFTPPIINALNFGTIRTGVALSASQASQVNMAAGVKIDLTLQQYGYYLQILPASVQTIADRESPPCSLWYMDGGSIQKLNLSSVAVF